MATYAAMLTEAKAALNDIIEGRVQSYTVNGQQYNWLNLDKLRELIDWLEGKTAQKAGRSNWSLGVRRRHT